MDKFTTEIIQTLAQNGNIGEVFRSHLEKAVNTLLAQELTAFLNYEKYDRIGFNSGNSRNGVYERTLHTEYGDLKLEIPRDRNGDFRQQTIAPYKRSNDTLENTVIHLFQKGITMTEIAHLIERMYGHHYSPQTVSNMTQAMNDEVEAYHNRQLSNRYSCVYLDATYIPIKRDTVAKEAVYLAIGIRLDGSKEVLGYTIAPTESVHVWRELLENFRERGMEEVLLFISDGLKGVEAMLSEVYPHAHYQTCLVHVQRNLSHKVRTKDRAEVCDDFKQVYRAETVEEAIQARERFIKKWQTAYPKLVPMVKGDAILTFYAFPQSIRRSIYSTNLIESVNKQLKKYTKRKEQFPNEASLERFLVSQLNDYNTRFLARCHLGFDQARAELEAMLDR